MVWVVPSAAVTGSPSSSSTGTTLRMGVAVRVTCWPSRSTTMGTASPTRGRMSVPTSVVSSTGWPAMDTKRSPGRMPAASAGVSGWSVQVVASPALVTGTTHCDTEATTAPGCAVATPCTVTRRVSRTTPMRRFMVGPPSMTMTFWCTGSR